MLSSKQFVFLKICMHLLQLQLIFFADINECSRSSPCKAPNQICVNTPGSYRCVCKPGYAGKNCETNLDNCKSKPCDSERSTGCRDKENDYYCSCFKGWEGKNCTESMYASLIEKNALRESTHVKVAMIMYVNSQSIIMVASSVTGHSMQIFLDATKLLLKQDLFQ